jgi:alanine-glyoxylate transaminase/serine-glyoxylate transaminase/serine-pyruvate transaminase
VAADLSPHGVIDVRVLPAREARATAGGGCRAGLGAPRARVGALLQTELPELGFRLVAADGVRLPQLTAALLSDGLDDAPGRRRLLTEFGVEVGGRPGAFAGPARRVGLMGHAATERSVVTLLGAVRELLKE